MGGGHPLEFPNYRRFIPLWCNPTLGPVNGHIPPTPHQDGHPKRARSLPSSQLPPPQLPPWTVLQGPGRETQSLSPTPCPPSLPGGRSPSTPLPTTSVLGIPTHARPLGAAWPQTPEPRAQRRVPRAAMDPAWARCSVGRKGGQGLLPRDPPAVHADSWSSAPPRRCRECCLRVGTDLQRGILTGNSWNS